MEELEWDRSNCAALVAEEEGGGSDAARDSAANRIRLEAPLAVEAAAEPEAARGIDSSAALTGVELAIASIAGGT